MHYGLQFAQHYAAFTQLTSSMVFIAYGLNHKTAPLEVREKLAFSDSRHDRFLCQLLDSQLADEAALLSTCNRTEIYCETSDPSRLIHWFANEHHLSPEALSPYCYLHHEKEGLRHTLRVASGLDSMMLGEPQILGQMKNAFHQACRLGTIKSTLRPIFEHVFKASKRIRTLSGIGCNPISIAYAAVQLIGESFSTTHDLRVLLIGSGETAALVAKYLHQQGVSQFFVASRTVGNAAKLAAPLNGTPISISDIADYLPEVDVVISATACPIPFITKNMVSQALSQRQNQSMFFLDLAVPRDIEPNVAELGAITLYNIDDLQNQITHNLNQRQHAAIEAEQLLEGELNNYLRWNKIISAKQIICDYREAMMGIAKQELNRTIKQLNKNTNQTDALEELCYRLVQKLTHIPTARIKQVASESQDDLLSLIHTLYKAPESIHEEIA